MTDAFDIQKCNVPHIKKIPDKNLLTDCVIEPAPDVLFGCQTVFTLPSTPTDGWPGACPKISATAQYQTTTNPNPSVTHTLTGPSSRDACDYDLQFVFGLPVPTCPEVGVTSVARTTVLPAVGARAEFVKDPSACEYDLSTQFDIPCANVDFDISLNARRTSSDQGLATSVQRYKDVCDYRFDLDLDVPCPKIEIHPRVVRQPLVTVLIFRREDDEQVFVEPEPITIQPKQSTTPCSNEFDFYFDFPCPQVRMTGAVTSGGGKMSFATSISKEDGRPGTDVVAMPPEPDTCNVDFDMKLDLWCSKLDIAATVTPEPTTDFRKKFAVKVNKIHRGNPPVHHEGGPSYEGYVPEYDSHTFVVDNRLCEFDFDMQFQIPKHCPTVTINEAIIAPAGNEFRLVFEKLNPQASPPAEGQQCEHVFQPILQISKRDYCPMAYINPYALQARYTLTALSPENRCSTFTTKPDHCLFPAIEYVLFGEKASYYTVCTTGEYEASAATTHYLQQSAQMRLINAFFDCCKERWEGIRAAGYYFSQRITFDPFFHKPCCNKIPPETELDLSPYHPDENPPGTFPPGWCHHASTYLYERPILNPFKCTAITTSGRLVTMPMTGKNVIFLSEEILQNSLW